MNANTKRIVRIAFFTAVALVMSLLENALPPLFAFAPAVKLGLANVVSIVVLIISGVTDAYAVLLARCVLASVFGGNVSAMMYSVPAGALSLAVVALMYGLLFPKVGLASISVAGACVHNAVQICVASLIVKANLFAVLPVMLLASVLAGAFTGLAAWFTVKYLPKKAYL